MELRSLEPLAECVWRHPPRGRMRVPVVFFGDRELLAAMDEKVLEQAANVATLPGIVGASYCMPDAHWGYGFPIGGVAAFDPDEGGVVSAGGVGFDISCGVRTLHTGLDEEALAPVRERLADALFRHIPAGVGVGGRIRLDDEAMEAMLRGGARWAVAEGWGEAADLARVEEGGCVAGADPDAVSARAKARQRPEMGTLGSGNHYLEVQRVGAIHDREAARAYGLEEGAVVVSLHCGSRGLGHQIGTDYLPRMARAAAGHGIALPDRELACAPIRSEVGAQYLGAMRAAINCALANRQILTHLVREVFADVLPAARITLLYDVSHNTCKEERHVVDGVERTLFVHRKGATRAFGPGSPGLPPEFAAVGQPVLIGGTMGTASWVLAGRPGPGEGAFQSACHGAGRRVSRRQASRRWQGRSLIEEMAARGILLRGRSLRGLAEEAPGAYKDVDAVVEAAERAGLARRVARLEPLICIKG
ncbi:RtcB family protein [Inmirania thermothiophila]|uniref:tRNA-splicing ligase RtcB n=1 Tax=Inmirania thermothiophila TaxID=1750597 RepID=A0A3N1Y241_9GAMM|nr:RtcB family protein [Inmirania thermothiophila]ROR32588.1 tRNA-splicing ligase RtcB [Inmirania thermothiophila]